MGKPLRRKNGGEGVKKPRDWRDMTLVEPEDAPEGVPKFDPKIVPGTKYRFDGNQLESLVTIMPDDVHVSWSTCGRCLGRLNNCKCSTGIIHTQGIEWIYIRTLLWKAGILVGERITTDHHEVRTRGLYWYAPKGSDSFGPMSHIGFIPGTKRRAGKKPLRKRGPEQPGNAPVTGRKPLPKGGKPGKRLGPSERHVEPAVGLRELERHASKRATDLEAAFTQDANNNKKRLGRKTEKPAKKKPLRKKGK